VPAPDSDGTPPETGGPGQNAPTLPRVALPEPSADECGRLSFAAPSSSFNATAEPVPAPAAATEAVSASADLAADSSAGATPAAVQAAHQQSSEGEQAEAVAEQAPAPSAAGLPAEVLLAAGLAPAALPFDREALDAAVVEFLRGLEDAGQTLRDTVSGMGPGPWLAALAAALTAYEAARRQRAGKEAAALAEALPGGGV
jgi:hypothetical protein